MSDNESHKKPDDVVTSTERREALVKIGKYAAYTAPAMLVTVRSVGAVPVTPPPPTSTPN